MNSEQEALAEVVEANPILRLVAHTIARRPERQEIELSEAGSRRGTGLSTGLPTAQNQKALEWLVRTGFLRQITAKAYPMVNARYAFDIELRERASGWHCAPFGSVGRWILEAAAQKFCQPSSDTRFDLEISPDGDVLDACGHLLPRVEAREVRLALDRYLAKYDEMGEEAFKKHKKTQEGFLWWSSLDSTTLKSIARGTLSQYLSPLICDCDRCKKFHEIAFTTLTNYFNYQRQEKKQLRAALKAIA